MLDDQGYNGLFYLVFGILDDLKVISNQAFLVLLGKLFNYVFLKAGTPTYWIQEKNLSISYTGPWAKGRINGSHWYFWRRR